ncbi:MAG: hypothetical protein HC836_45605 [Richelia sp. RM2_1_2]|nr:hypothetical protein [Richelia sp. RM2_1_2]
MRQSLYFTKDDTKKVVQDVKFSLSLRNKVGKHFSTTKSKEWVGTLTIEELKKLINRK